MKKSEAYGIIVNIKSAEGGHTDIYIKNTNSFRINNIYVDVQPINENIAGEYKNRWLIKKLEAGAEWHSEKSGNNDVNDIYIDTFEPVGYYKGQKQIIDENLYDKAKGVYNGEIHHSLVWPDKDNLDKWKKEIIYEFREFKLKVVIRFIAYGPRIAFIGHSFTGLWDSSYYYLRELAKLAGWNCRIAYSYWGGTGIAHYAGLVSGCEERAEQCDKVLESNDYYDFCSFAGNSDEAVSTYTREPGAKDYSQRTLMLEGAQILYNKAKKKKAKCIFFVPQPYKYGFFGARCKKPWKEGKVGDIYEKDGEKYTLVMSRSQMAEANMEWYKYMVANIGNNIYAAPVAKAYDYIISRYPDIIDPYLPVGNDNGDNGHQNNVGNYIAACVYYELIFKEPVEGLGVPQSHTWGMAGGKVTEEQAYIIQKCVTEIMRNTSDNKY